MLPVLAYSNFLRSLPPCRAKHGTYSFFRLGDRCSFPKISPRSFVLCSLLTLFSVGCSFFGPIHHVASLRSSMIRLLFCSCPPTCPPVLAMRLTPLLPHQICFLGGGSCESLESGPIFFVLIFLCSPFGLDVPSTLPVDCRFLPLPSVCVLLPYTENPLHLLSPPSPYLSGRFAYRLCD